MKITNSIRNIILLVLTLCVVSICYSFYLLEGDKTDKIISFASNLMRLSFTVGTFLIAILLFDRFGFRKKLFEKKLEIVLSLLVLLKENIIFVCYRNVEKDSTSFYKIYPGKKMLNSISKKTNEFSYVVFDNMTVRDSLDMINKLKNNPFLPKEISESLEFLSLNELWGVNNDALYSKEHSQLMFNHKPGAKHQNLEGWSRSNENITLKSFIEKYEKSFKIIENWLDEHSNIKSELNI